MRAFNDLTGLTFGRLTVLGQAGKTSSGGYKWNCACQCGVLKAVSSDHLVRDKQPVTSCGCYRNDQVRAAAIDPCDTAFNLLLGAYRKRARIKGRTFDLDAAAFKTLTKGNCEYCGSPPSTEAFNKPKSGSYVHNGIDRVNPQIGYISSNCVSCCKLCNYMKLALPKDKFLSHVKAISEHQARLANG
jgi:hypothetical protein